MAIASISGPTPIVLSSSLPSSASSSHFHTTPSPSPTSASFNTLARSHPPPSPGLFSRARSHSVHSSSTGYTKGHDAPPPLPTVSSPISPSTLHPIPERPWVRIKSCSVPHHTKNAAGKWVYACRVVPEVEVGKAVSNMSRKDALGPMAMAGMGDAREPYTVWRTWSEFVDFSGRLSSTFAVVPSSPPSSSSTLPSSFYRQTPRLSKKLTLFVTRSTLISRQDDLDLFVRRLFDMPPSVKESRVVCEFFRMAENDPVEVFIPPAASSMETVRLKNGSRVGLAEGNDATVRGLPSKPKGMRPRLGMKHSTPDLRKLMMSEELEDAYDGFFGGASPPSLALGGGFPRPPLPNRTVSDSPRSSTSSSNTSTSTVVPSARLPSPLAVAIAPMFTSAPAPVADTLPLKVTPRNKGGPLRHFRSLQDLRQTAMSLPAPPLPSFLSSPMTRAATQPTPRTYNIPTPIITQRSVSGPASVPATQRQRSASKSSISSFDDGPVSPLLGLTGSTSFRHGPMGRLDRVPEGASRGSRRPARPPSCNKTSIGHSPSPSSSSVDSLRSSAAGSSWDMGRATNEKGYPSRRSSTDYSDGGGTPATPPTPAMDGAESCGPYYIDNGQLSQNNKVPPPPFFPVPPSMTSPMNSPPMSSSQFQDRTPTSRKGSGSSQRPTDLSHHSHGSTASRPQDRPTLTFKILSSESNFIVRVARTGLSFSSLKLLIEGKFATGCSTKLTDAWRLVHTTARTSGAAEGQEEGEVSYIFSEETFQRLLETNSHLEKISLRVLLV